MRANLQRKASADFLRRYRDGGGGLYLGPMYDHTGQPPNEHDEHEVGKVTIHCPIIAVLCVLHIREEPCALINCSMRAIFGPGN